MKRGRFWYNGGRWTTLSLIIWDMYGELHLFCFREDEMVTLWWKKQEAISLSSISKYTSSSLPEACSFWTEMGLSLVTNSLSNSRLMGSKLYSLDSLLTDSDWFGVSMFQILIVNYYLFSPILGPGNLRTCEHLDLLLTLQTYFSTYAVFFLAANVFFFFSPSLGY